MAMMQRFMARGKGWGRGLLFLLFLVPLLATGQTSRFDYFFLEAEKCRLAEDYASATELFAHCLRINPDAPEALYGMGLMQYILRNDSIGNKYLKRACEIDSCNPWYLTTLAATYLERRNTDAVVPILERLARMEPKRTDVLSQLASIYHTRGENLKAIDVLNRIERHEGVNTALSLEKTSLYMEMGDSAQAFAELEALRKEFPHDMNNLVIIGNQYQLAGDNDKAMALYDEVRRRDPANERLQFAMLSHYLNTEQRPQYIAMRDSMLFAPSTSAELRATMLKIYLADAKNDSLPHEVVSATIDSLLAMPQRNAQLLMIKAAYQTSDGISTEEDFNETMKQILKIEPNHRVALEQLLQYYGRTNDMPALEEICRRGVNYYPEELPYRYYLGISLLQQEKRSEALEILQQGLLTRDEDAGPSLVSDMFALVGDVMYSLKKENEALAVYDSALVYNPDNISCLNNYAYYLSLRNEQLDKAEEMSYRTVRAEPKNKTYLDTYAWILFMKEDYTGARRYIERVVDSDAPADSLLAEREMSAAVLEHAGDIYAKCGEMDKALYYWDLALRSPLRADDKATPLLKKKLKKKKYIK